MDIGTFVVGSYNNITVYIGKTDFWYFGGSNTTGNNKGGYFNKILGLGGITFRFGNNSKQDSFHLEQNSRNGTILWNNRLWMSKWYSLSSTYAISLSFMKYIVDNLLNITYELGIDNINKVIPNITNKTLEWIKMSYNDTIVLLPLSVPYYFKEDGYKIIVYQRHIPLMIH